MLNVAMLQDIFLEMALFKKGEWKIETLEKLKCQLFVITQLFSQEIVLFQHSGDAWVVKGTQEAKIQGSIWRVVLIL